MSPQDDPSHESYRPLLPFPPIRRAPFNKFLVALYALTHLVGDSYGAFLPPLLPAFQRRFALNKFECGALAATQATTVSLIQPFLGLLSDRFQTRQFLVLGPAAAGVFFSLIGNAPSFWWLIALLMAGGLGIAALHPSGAALAAQAGGRKRHLALSIWVAGGIVGLALGFCLVVVAVQKLGLQRLGFLMIPALILSALIYKYVPATRSGDDRPPARPLRETVIPKSLRLLFAIGFCRGLIGTAIATFTPLLLAERGYPLAAGGNALALFMLVGAGGNLLGGWLAEKMGPRAIISSSYLLTFPALVGFSLTHGPTHLLFLMASGLLLLASVPAEIVLAQKTLPQHAAAVSGIFTGAIWGVGGLSMMGAGALADSIGTQNMMLALWPLALVAALLAAFLPPLPSAD